MSDSGALQRANRAGCLIIVGIFVVSFVGVLALLVFTAFSDQEPDPQRLRLYQQAYPVARRTVNEAPASVCRVNVINSLIDGIDPFANLIEESIWFDAFTDACIVAGQLDLNPSEYFEHR